MKKTHILLQMLQMVSQGSLWFLMHSFDPQSSFIKFFWWEPLVQIHSDFLSSVLVVEPGIPKSLKFSFGGGT